MKFKTVLIVVLAAATCLAADEKLEARAKRSVKNAVQLFAQNEDERAVGILEAVGRMYKETDAKFLELSFDLLFHDCSSFLK